MTQVTFVAADGGRLSIDATDGLSLMECARRAGIAEIVAECGGACSCATCHVHVDPAWTSAVGEPAAAERDMLEFADDVRPASRLSCQIKIGPQLDGLVVHLPTAHG